MSFMSKNPLSLPEINHTPSTPSGTRGIFAKEDGWYSVDDNGKSSRMLDENDMSRDAILLAMYNEIIEPSPSGWFEVDENDPSKIIGYKWENTDFLSATELIYPYEIDGVKVRKIYIPMSENFSDVNTAVQTIRLPNCITEIMGDGGMLGWTFPNTISINIPTSCAHIGNAAFGGMTLLEEIISPVKPNWELVIEGECFYGCSSMNNIDTIIDGVKKIEYGSFYDCSSVKNAIIPESVEAVESGALAFGSDTNCITFLNPDCVFDSYNGIKSSIFLNEEYYPKVIKGYTGSTAETLANEIGVEFIPLDRQNDSIIDSEMSDTSTNPVQNKIIKGYVDDAIQTAILDSWEVPV